MYSPVHQKENYHHQNTTNLKKSERATLKSNDSLRSANPRPMNACLPAQSDKLRHTIMVWCSRRLPDWWTRRRA